MLIAMASPISRMEIHKHQAIWIETQNILILTVHVNIISLRNVVKSSSQYSNNDLNNFSCDKFEAPSFSHTPSKRHDSCRVFQSTAKLWIFTYISIYVKANAYARLKAIRKQTPVDHMMQGFQRSFLATIGKTDSTKCQRMSRRSSSIKPRGM